MGILPLHGTASHSVGWDMSQQSRGCWRKGISTFSRRLHPLMGTTSVQIKFCNVLWSYVGVCVETPSPGELWSTNYEYSWRPVTEQALLWCLMTRWHGMCGADLPTWGNTAPFSCLIDWCPGAGGSFVKSFLAVGHPCEYWNTLGRFKLQGAWHMFCYPESGGQPGESSGMILSSSLPPGVCAGVCDPLLMPLPRGQQERQGDTG